VSANVALQSEPGTCSFAATMADDQGMAVGQRQQQQHHTMFGRFWWWLTFLNVSYLCSRLACSMLWCSVSNSGWL
jgi:hypothetical protein